VELHALNGLSLPLTKAGEFINLVVGIDLDASLLKQCGDDAVSRMFAA